MSAVDRIEDVAKVDPRDRTARAAQRTVSVAGGFGRERDARSMMPVLDPRGDEADDPVMPTSIEDHQCALLGRTVDGRGLRLCIHPGLDLAPLPVQAIEFFGHPHGRVRVRRQQTLDAKRHVGQAAGD